MVLCGVSPLTLMATPTTITTTTTTTTNSNNGIWWNQSIFPHHHHRQCLYFSSTTTASTATTTNTTSSQTAIKITITIRTQEYEDAYEYGQQEQKSNYHTFISISLVVVFQWITNLPAGFWQPNTNDSIDSVDETIESSSLDPVKTFQERMMKMNRFRVVKIVIDLFLFLIY